MCDARALSREPLGLEGLAVLQGMFRCRDSSRAILEAALRTCCDYW